ncbi:glycine oxidase ThiO [Thalassoglobus polymorphus]|uniref:Hydrogen cyanide synthase subunit HcnC n=1 Tax=Thalassoglobus polymorphus TaxID=2527994 RepID=A0A517QNC7_9PLAN|nr:glycine oxidase ThiO [Thalassoglobus polymorphus]QDT33133.1 Hydrogen cyanide synthase subunit HcnC precursor [Thalassoglobus polymorphus]
MKSTDFLVIGGGVIGLSIAYELAGSGATVTVVDRQKFGQEASWAGAGMLPPAQCSGPPALRELAKLSRARWKTVSEELLSLTGIDNGFRECSALQISIENRNTIPDEIEAWGKEDVQAELLNGNQLQQYEPLLSDMLHTGFRLPTMAQVRNPHHIVALKKACEQLNVQLVEGENIAKFELSQRKISAATSNHEHFTADKFILCAGAWSPQIVEQLGVHLEMEPVRGQIVLLKFDKPKFTHIIEDGPKYLVPRDDGHVLVGATVERVGFEKANTTEGVKGLLEFATQVVPILKDAELVKTWSGFRPATLRGVPYLGWSKKIDNLFVATGHFRDGLAQSTGTAKLVGDIILDRKTSIDVSAFAV